MADDAHVIAVDQGTGSTRAVVVGPDGHAEQVAAVPLSVTSPRHGWVEQDPNDILDSVVSVLRTAGQHMTGSPVCIGLSNQRESALAWDARTGEPLGPVLGWQDRRTVTRARQLQKTVGGRIRHLSGLPVDPMFSALKIEWLLDEVDPDRSRASRGDIRVGTVDTWLVQQLTGTGQAETGNASRTQLLNVRTADWDDELLDIFNVPRQALAPVVSSDAPTAPVQGIGAGIDGLRITGVLGDSHAALFAHGVRAPGAVKATYGTGSSIMGLTAAEVEGTSGLVETIGWQRKTVARAFEGNILSTGATLVWLGNVLEQSPAELAELARSVGDSGGVNLVPAFAGLGAPWWDGNAAAVIDGFDQSTTRAHLARAALECIPLQVEDVLARADTASGATIETVLVDGRPCRNDWLMQLQADLSGRLVLRPHETGLSAVGAAHMAGLGAGFWADADVESLRRPREEFAPSTAYARGARLESWRLAVGRSRHTAARTPA